MRQLPFGPHARPVPTVGIGTWQMEADDAAGATRAIQRAIELGASHVDTAEMYGDGEVETLVGRAIAGRRDDVFLVSKVLPSHASRAGTIVACERSLARLGTDHLDLYLLHWREHLPLAETFEAFEALRAAGKIRAWGVSNFDADDLAEAVALAGPHAIACNQVCYHLLERTIEHEVLPFCRRHRIAVVAYSPFGSGTFPSPSSPAGAVLAAQARRLGATPHQLALAFLVRQGTFVIPKSSDVAHVESNTAAADLTLDAEAVAALDAAFPVGPWRGLPTV